MQEKKAANADGVYTLESIMAYFDGEPPKPLEDNEEYAHVIYQDIYLDAMEKQFQLMKGSK